MFILRSPFNVTSAYAVVLSEEAPPPAPAQRAPPWRRAIGLTARFRYLFFVGLYSGGNNAFRLTLRKPRGPAGSCCPLWCQTRGGSSCNRATFAAPGSPPTFLGVMNQRADVDTL